MKRVLARRHRLTGANLSRQAAAFSSSSAAALESPPPWCGSLDHDDYARFLRECAGPADLARGRCIHAQIAETELGQETYVGNNLVSMYSRCGSLEEAFRTFVGIKAPNLSTWNVMIAAYAQHGHLEESVALFHGMLSEGLMPNRVTLVTVLNACTGPGELATGKLIHRMSSECGLTTNVVMGTSLLNMYGKCGTLEDSVEVFQGIIEKNVICYNAMVLAFSNRGCWKQAIQLFFTMQQQGVKPSDVSFLNLLTACSLPGAPPATGKLIHSCISQSEHCCDLYLRTGLINMYTRCGDLAMARNVFDDMSCDKNAVTWNIMIAAYAESEQRPEALYLFRRMQLEGEACDRVTLLSALAACACPQALEDGRRIHGYIQETFFELVLGTAIIAMYARCCSPEDARSVFRRMEERNLITWNSIMMAYANLGHSDEAVYYFRRMQQEGMIPNRVTFITLLNAFGQAPESLSGTRQVERLVSEQGLESEVSLSNALVTAYGKCGSPEDARQVFDRLQQPDRISWNAITATYTQAERYDEALLLFKRMLLEGVRPDKVSFVTVLAACSSPGYGRVMHKCLVECGLDADIAVQTALVHMHGTGGELDKASSILEGSSAADIAAWNVLVAAYALHGNSRKAVKLYQYLLLDGASRPDRVTFVNVLNACGSSQDWVAEGKLVHSHVLECGLDSERVVVNALTSMYGKCGHLIQARDMFERSSSRNNQVLWNVMLATYAQHGHAEEVLRLMRRMEQEGVKQDGISFISVLSACSHAGLIDEGWCYFHSLSQDRGMEPSMVHYGCMVDLLARAGKLEEAERCVKDMPFKPGAVIWMSLFGASSVQRDAHRGKLAVQQLLRHSLS